MSKMRGIIGIMPFYNWGDVEAETVEPGIKRRVLAGKNVMLVLYEIDPGKGLPEHKHPHEQFGYIIEGETELKIGDEEAVLRSGGVFYVPPDTKHGGKVLGDETLIELDVFHPLREEFLIKESK